MGLHSGSYRIAGELTFYVPGLREAAWRAEKEAACHFSLNFSHCSALTWHISPPFCLGYMSVSLFPPLPYKDQAYQAV